MSRSLLATVLPVATALGLFACGGALPPAHLFPTGKAVLLLDRPVHLGDNVAGGQAFSQGDADASRLCTLVHLPRPSNAHLRVEGLRNSESLKDVITVNGQAFALPITLERDPAGVSSNATAAAPLYPVVLPEGPSEVCIVSGVRPCGDLDDFEVDQVELYLQEVSSSDVSVRRNLGMGRPLPVNRPSKTWGQEQRPYPSVTPGAFCSVD